MIMKENKNSIETSAGVVIIREDDKLGPCILLLSTYGKFDLPKGHVDVIDSNDEQLMGSEAQIKNTAIREAYEECGFKIIDNASVFLPQDEQIARLVYSNEVPITCGNFNEKDKETKNLLSKSIVLNGVKSLPNNDLLKLKKIVYLYVAETKCKSASIEKNPNGIYEHESYTWYPISTIASSNLHMYLRAGVAKAFKIYKTHKHVEEAIIKINTL